MTNRFILLSLGALFVMLESCKEEESPLEKQAKEDDRAIQAYLNEHDINAEKSLTGAYYEVLRANESGEGIQNNDIPSFLYTLQVLDGDTIMETYGDTLNPLKFQYEQTFQAIFPQAVGYEIARMKVGEKYRFFIPSLQAFGGSSQPGLFGPDANLILVVDLLQVYSPEQLLGAEKDTIQAYAARNGLNGQTLSNGLLYLEDSLGTGPTVTDNSTVKFHYVAKYLDGTVFDASSGQPLTANLAVNDLIAGVETGLKMMKEGGQATFIFPSNLGYGRSVQVIPQELRRRFVEDNILTAAVKPYSILIFEIDLVEVD